MNQETEWNMEEVNKLETYDSADYLKTEDAVVVFLDDYKDASHEEKVVAEEIATRARAHRSAIFS